MAVTIDSISHGRFGVNIISGWQRPNTTRWGSGRATSTTSDRYEYCAEYVDRMQELWATGRSDFKGDFFKMDDCRLGPLPSRQSPIICAGQSDPGMRLRRRIRDYNFCTRRGGSTSRRACADMVTRLKAATADRQRHAARWC